MTSRVTSPATTVDLGSTSVRPMQVTDIEAVARVHLRAFPGFFLSALGYRFLICLYREIVKEESGIAFVAVVRGEIAGFVAGSAEPAGMYKRLLKRRWHRFALASLWPLLRSPAILPRLLGAFRKPAEERKPAGYGLLMSIGVSPDHQNLGLGRKLVVEFLQESKRKALSAVYLTTDAVGNDSTNRFYVGLGFRQARSYSTPQGRLMNEYLIELDA